MDRHILAVPGGDGFGPSSLMSHVVRDLLGHGCRVTIWNGCNARGELYNRRLFPDESRVDVVPVADLIVLGKRNGGPSIPATLANVDDYRRRSDAYPGLASVPRFDLVLDFGVPAAAWCALRRGIPSISLFDHAWSRTLELMLDVLPATPSERSDWQQTIEEIRADERHVRELFLFPPYITPEVFRAYWRDVIGVKPVELPGVLGGQHGWSRDEARAFLGVTQPGPTVLIQAGDTPAWDPVIPALVGAFAAQPLDATLVIHVPDRVMCPKLAAAFENGGPRLRRLAFPPGTIQKLLPAVDLMISRAGGGTVNDALACRVPLVCVEEPGQTQVALILQALEDRGLTRRIAWQDFHADPAGVCRAQWEHAGNRRLAEHMAGTPLGAERTIVRRILEVMG